MGNLFSYNFNVNNIIITNEKFYTSGDNIDKLIKQHKQYIETYGFFNRKHEINSNNDTDINLSYPCFSYNLSQIKTDSTHDFKMSDLTDLIFTNLLNDKYKTYRNDIKTITLVSCDHDSTSYKFYTMRNTVSSYDFSDNCAYIILNYGDHSGMSFSMKSSLNKCINEQQLTNNSFNENKEFSIKNIHVDNTPTIDIK